MPSAGTMLYTVFEKSFKYEMPMHFWAIFETLFRVKGNFMKMRWRGSEDQHGDPAAGTIGKGSTFSSQGAEGFWRFLMVSSCPVCVLAL